MKDEPCDGFQWLGQPLWSCEGCGWPYWEHTHDLTIDRAVGPFGPPIRVPISSESADAVRRKWARNEPAERRERRSALRAKASS